MGRFIFEGRDITDLDITERARMGIGIAQQRPPSLPGVALRSVAEYILKDKPNKKDEMNELADATRVKTFLDRGINEGAFGRRDTAAPSLCSSWHKIPSFQCWTNRIRAWTWNP